MPSSNQDGQVLLLIVLLITMLLTVVMAVGYRAAKDTQVVATQKTATTAELAAETAIDMAIAQNVLFGKHFFNTLNMSSSLSQDIDMTISQVNLTKEPDSPDFLSQELERDQQMVFYLDEYDIAYYEFIEDLFSENLYIYYTDSAGTCLGTSLEITVLYQSDPATGVYDIRRYVSADGSVLGTIDPTDNMFDTADANSVGGYAFTCVADTSRVTDYATLPNKRLMLVRAIPPDSSEDTYRIGFRSGDTSVNLPAQGLQYTATAVTTDGIKRTATAYQSYPQIPAEIFVPSLGE